MNREALVIVDFHKAFGKLWWLPVAWAEEIAPAIQNQMNLTRTASWLIVATRDWHPKNTVHFKNNGGPWPIHGEAWSQESEYIDGIDTRMIDHHIYKGYKDSDDGYSWFEGVDKLIGNAEMGFQIASDARSLEQILRESSVRVLKIVWLATDFCVFSTAKDGKELWFDVEVIRSGIAAVNVPGLPSGEEKLRQLADVWVKIVS